MDGTALYLGIAIVVAYLCLSTVGLAALFHAVRRKPD
jgi:hypothetical protein